MPEVDCEVWIREGQAQVAAIMRDRQAKLARHADARRHGWQAYDNAKRRLAASVGPPQVSPMMAAFYFGEDNPPVIF